MVGATPPPPPRRLSTGAQERDTQDDYGWKLVYADVFRRPPHLTLLATLVGTGWQLTLLIAVVVILTIASDLYTEYELHAWAAMAMRVRSLTMRASSDLGGMSPLPCA